MLRRPLTLVAAAAVFSLAACGEPAAKPAHSPTGASATGVHVEVAEMELGDGKDAFLIHADGSLISPKGTAVGSVKANGEVLNSEGKSVATLGADGKVDFGANGEGVTATIGDDGSLTVTEKGGETFTAKIGDDGTVTGTNPGAGKLVVKGADTPAKKRAVMLVLLAITMRKEAGQPPPPVSSGPLSAPPAAVGKP